MLRAASSAAPSTPPTAPPTSAVLFLGHSLLNVLFDEAVSQTTVEVGRAVSDTVYVVVFVSGNEKVPRS